LAQWFGDSGVVTGGDYEDNGQGDSCMPYSLPLCYEPDPDDPNPDYPVCPAGVSDLSR
jgi:hypothetical protein